MRVRVEVRAAEGGEDSKLFAKDLAQSYIKFFTRVGWLKPKRSEEFGVIILEIECDQEFFNRLKNESGGHRIQRVPPTERKGRVHTSTVTVAVIDCNDKSSDKFKKRSNSDFKIEWYSGTGKGGQHRNKHQNSARVTHLPTGIVETSQNRSRENSLDEAMQRINFRLDELAKNDHRSVVKVERQNQVGSGMRGDKIRTYRFQDDVVQDHQSGKRSSTAKILSGNFDLLWQ